VVTQIIIAEKLRWPYAPERAQRTQSDFHDVEFGGTRVKPMWARFHAFHLDAKMPNCLLINPLRAKRSYFVQRFTKLRSK